MGEEVTDAGCCGCLFKHRVLNMTGTSSAGKSKLRSELIFSKRTKFSGTSKHASENTHIPVSGWVPLIFSKSAHTLLFQKVSTLLSARMCSHHYLPESAHSLLHQEVPTLSSISAHSLLHQEVPSLSSISAHTSMAFSAALL